jgi:ribosomal protein S12 methylthiotransferase accessory factor
MKTLVRPTFAAELSGPGHAALRRRIGRLAASTRPHPLHVSSVMGRWLRRDADVRRGGPACHLLLDLHRIFIYDDPGDGQGPGVDSVVRAIVDAYPFQPFAVLAERLRNAPHPFLHSLNVLDAIPLARPHPMPGTLTALDLLTGEITRSRPLEHPDTHPPVTMEAADAMSAPAAGATPARWTDASLREGKRANVDALLSADVGPVRERSVVANHAALPFSVTRVAWNEGRQQELCGAKGLRPSEAEYVGVCEALERFQVAFPPPGETLVRGTAAGLDGLALDLPSLIFGGIVPDGDPRPVATDGTPLHWTWAADPLGGPAALVPAQDVWFHAARRLGEPQYVEPTTSGCAVGGSVEEAGLFALLECIERDAFLTTWYLRRPCARIDPDSVDYEPFQLLRRRWHAAYPGYALHLFDITTDTAVPVVAAIAVRQAGEGPRTFHAAAARLSGERACHAALKDLTGFTPAIAPGRLDEMRRLLDHPELVTGPAGHFELFALDEAFDRLSFLDFGPAAGMDARELGPRSPVPAADRYEIGDVLRCIAAHLRTAGAAVYLKDLTHAEIGRRGLHCVRAVTPGLFPIWFGSRLRRFAVTPRLQRLARDLVGRDLSRVEDFNLELHPFS